MSVDYITTLGSTKQLPSLLNGEYLLDYKQARIPMLGRSNVGKSSLINALVRANVAQSSKKAGCTRKIIFYHWKEINHIITDLPGYGFAHGPREETIGLFDLTQAYLVSDENISSAVLLLDARHGPTDLDLEALEFLQGEGINYTLVFSKKDALKNQKMRAKRQKEVTRILKPYDVDISQTFWVSAHSGEGLGLLTDHLRGRKESRDRTSGDGFAFLNG